MKTALETAIKALVEKAKGSVPSHEAMQLTQAALNLAHVQATLREPR
jgi:hypothetical protein